MMENLAMISPTEFKDAMSRISYSVSVVSTTAEGRTYGKTINTLAPVSADDPSILISLYRTSEITQKILENREFSVSVLSDSQKSIAEEFAGRLQRLQTDGQARSPVADRQLVVDAVATFQCVLVTAMSHASHVVMIGRVTAVAGTDSLPLLHHRRAYRPCAEHVLA